MTDKTLSDLDYQQLAKLELLLWNLVEDYRVDLTIQELYNMVSDRRKILDEGAYTV